MNDLAWDSYLRRGYAEEQANGECSQQLRDEGERWIDWFRQENDRELLQLVHRRRFATVLSFMVWTVVMGWLVSVGVIAWGIWGSP